MASVMKERSLLFGTENNLRQDPIPCTVKPVDGPWDSLVIGSGISGLTTAASLSMTGDRVLVLEQHFQVGGFTHVFRRNNLEFDVGIHYLGRIHHKSDWYMELMGLTEGRIQFEKLGDISDRLIFPDLQLDIPTSYDGYKKMLIELFPKEKDGINRYVDKINHTNITSVRYFALNLLPKPLTRFARRTFVKGLEDCVLTTTDKMMSRYFKDERLKDIIDAEWLNIGMPRQKCSFLVHACMMAFFLENGAFYPKGGASVFARELGKTIYKYGGHIRIKADVDSIITSGNKAIGVRLSNGEEIFAKRIISSVGANNTYTRLLGDKPEVEKERNEIKSLPLSYEHICLFFGLNRHPAEFGINKENIWIMNGWNLGPDNVYLDFDRLDEQEQPPVFIISSSCQKNSLHGQYGDGGFNGQAIFLGKPGFFKEWEETKWKKRSNDYLDIKEKISLKIINAMEKHFPGIKKSIIFYELGSPLSFMTFSAHASGIPYGIGPTPERYRSTTLRPKTPIKNLYMTGQDIVAMGIPASLGSSMLTTSLIKKRDMASYFFNKGRKVLGVR
jgi:all-trans-retinol 13,14-reductase